MRPIDTAPIVVSRASIPAPARFPGASYRTHQPYTEYIFRCQEGPGQPLKLPVTSNGSVQSLSRLVRSLSFRAPLGNRPDLREQDCIGVLDDEPAVLQ